MILKEFLYFDAGNFLFPANILKAEGYAVLITTATILAKGNDGSRQNE
jgi:hypothetical protein